MNEIKTPNIPINIKKLLLFWKHTKYTLKDEEWKNIELNWKAVDISKLDIPDFNWIKDEEIINIIQINLDININTNDWLNKLNELFRKSIDLVSLSRIKIIFDKKWVNLNEINFPFKNKEDVIKFLRLSGDKSNWWIWKSACFIAKTCFSVNEILNTPWISNLEAEEAKLYQKFKQIFSIEEVWETSQWTIFGKKFIFHWRPKSLLSCLLKTIKDVEYTEMSKLWDWIQYTIEFDWSTEEKLELLNQLYYIAFGLWCQYNKSKIKWFEKDELLQIYWKEDDFSENVIKNAKFERKWASAKWYIDMKILFRTENQTPVEIKIIPKWSMNQDWINFQWIYAYLNKYIEWVSIRWINHWYIKEEWLEILVSDFFEQLPSLIRDNLEKRNTSEDNYLKELWNNLKKLWFIRRDVKFKNQITNKKTLLKTYLIPGLKSYFISKLNVIKLWNWEIIYTNDRADAIKEAFKDN